MDKRTSVRGIIIEDDEVYTIFRRIVNDDNSFKEYYVIPGGGSEKGETLEETLRRELKEELSIDVDIIGYLGCDDNDTSVAHFLNVEYLMVFLLLGEKN